MKKLTPKQAALLAVGKMLCLAVEQEATWEEQGGDAEEHGSNAYSYLREEAGDWRDTTSWGDEMVCKVLNALDGGDSDRDTIKSSEDREAAMIASNLLTQVAKTYGRN